MSRSRIAVVLPLSLLSAAILPLTACTPADSGPKPSPSVASVLATPTRAVLQDGGSRRFATGEATEEGGGHYRYVVARGDTLEGIATRFGVSPNALQSDSRGGLEIFAGDTLQLTTAT